MSDDSPVLPPRPWEADTSLSADAARCLIESQFPEFAPATLESCGVGWDNWAYRVNDASVFRFPRRTIAVPWLENEFRWLPRLDPLLPVSIPVPRFAGRPAEGYPFPFAGAEWIGGRTGCDPGFSEVRRVASAPALGRFLATLHGVSLRAGPGESEPADGIGRTDLARTAGIIRERLEGLPDGVVDRTSILALADALVGTAPWGGPPVWVHGDLYARHLVFGDEGALVGVIDWGDLHRGDPALDLSIVHSFLPESARAAFLHEYGAIDADTWARARLRALFYGVVLLEYGREIEDEALAFTGRVALSHVLT